MMGHNDDDDEEEDEKMPSPPTSPTAKRTGGGLKVSLARGKGVLSPEGNITTKFSRHGRHCWEFQRRSWAEGKSLVDQRASALT